MKRKWLLSLVAVVAIVAASYVAYRMLRPAPLPPGFEYGSGHIEGTPVKLAAEVAGRIVEMSLTEGSRVERGRSLVVIDRELGTEALSATRSELDALRSSRGALDAQLRSWGHHAQTSAQQVQRLQRLVQSRYASLQDLERAADAARQADAQIGQLQAQRQALDGQIAAAEARVASASTQLERTRILAPLDATVLVRTAELGEVVQAGQPLAVLTDLTRLKLKIYVPSGRLGVIRLNQPARLRVDSYPGRDFQAKVVRIDDYAQFTPRDIHLPEERSQMVYGVELAVDNAGGELKPGMPADAWIRVDDRAAWPAQLPVPR